MLVHGVLGRGTGVRRLVLEQASVWARLRPDIDVGLFVRCEAGSERDWRNEANVVAVQSSRFGILGRLIVRELLSVQVARWRPDVIYLRHTTVSPSLILLSSRFPTVIGGDLDELQELEIQSPLRYWYARLMRDRLLKRARRIMTTTNQLAGQVQRANYGRPIDVFPNSIDGADYPPLPAPENAKPRLAFLGAPGLAWVGVDKVIRMARLNSDWDFDVIGPSLEEIRDPPANVVVHGQLDRTEYLPIVAMADIAIGHLAPHRKGLSEISTLKVAEYLAYGIPVILANDEPAFPHGASFLLKLPNTESNVEEHHAEIRAFVNEWRGRRVPRDAMHAVDAMRVEARRLELIVSEARRTRGS